MDEKTKIIFLNGVGSVGKSSITKALQTVLQEPYLHVGIDQFIEMLPNQYLYTSEGIDFQSFEVDGHPVVKVVLGQIGANLAKGMRHAVAALAQQGNNLIIDEVLIGNEMEEYAELLAPFKVFYVGIYAPLDVLEERERLRGDRCIGLARAQYDIVHRNISYDFEIDTTTLSPLECAQLIKQKFNL